MMTESRLTALRNAFISGLVLLAPIGVTWLVVNWLVQTLGGNILSLIFPESIKAHPSMQFMWSVGATLVVLMLITGLGWLSRYVLGQFFAGLAERVIQSIPGINSIYNTVKQVVGTFGSHNKQMFSKVVLVELPRKGVWTLAFLTNKQQGEIQTHLRTEHWTIFVPTTPNPTGGYMLFMPKEDIIELDISVGVAMKMIISGGAVVPPNSDLLTAAYGRGI